MDKQPTQEQIKEFWEWYGFKELDPTQPNESVEQRALKTILNTLIKKEVCVDALIGKKWGTVNIESELTQQAIATYQVAEQETLKRVGEWLAEQMNSTIVDTNKCFHFTIYYKNWASIKQGVMPKE